jgi:predicted transcriptional regulator
MLITDAVVIRENTNLKEAVNRFASCDYLICPVVNSENRFAGILKLEDIRSHIDKQNIWSIILVHDAMIPFEHPLEPSTCLREGMEAANKFNLEQIPVIEHESGKVIGIFDTRTAKRFMEQKLIGYKTKK